MYCKRAINDLRMPKALTHTHNQTSFLSLLYDDSNKDVLAKISKYNKNLEISYLDSSSNTIQVQEESVMSIDGVKFVICYSIVT